MNRKTSSTSKLKLLQSQLIQAIEKSNVMKSKIHNLQKEYGNKLKYMDKIKKEIESLSIDDRIRISEHAFVRFFERVKGYNIEEIEKEILTEEVMNFVNKLGDSGTYPNKDFQVVFKNNVVTTIIKNK